MRSLYQEAESRFRSRDYEFALGRYDELITRYPLSALIPDAQYRKALCLFSLGRLAEAKRIFERVEVRHASTRYIDYVPLYKGLIAYKQGEQAEAVADFSLFLAKNAPSGRREALLHKGFAEYSLGRSEDAVRTLNQLMELKADPASESEALLILSSLYAKKGDYESLTSLLDGIDLTVFEKDKQEKLTLYRAEALRARGEEDSAVAAYSGLLDASPEVSSVAFQRLFSHYQNAGDEENLEAVFLKSQVKLAGYPVLLRDFLVRIGIETYGRGRYELAQSYLLRVWKAPDKEGISYLVPLYLASIARRSGDSVRALSILNEYLAARKASFEGREYLLFLKGSLHLDGRQWAEAHSPFSELIAGYPDFSLSRDVPYLDALCLYKLGRFEEGLSRIETVFKAAQEGALAASYLRLRALLYAKTGSYEAAIDDVRAYIPLKSSDMDARVDLVKLLFLTKDYEAVVAEAGRLKAENPELTTPCDRLLSYFEGLSSVASGEYGRAVSALSRLERSGAEAPLIHPYALFYLGWAYYRQAKYADAVKSFTLLAEGYPEHELFPKALYFAGWSAYASADYRAAEGFFGGYGRTKALENQERSLFMYAKSMQAQKRYTEAGLMFKKLFTDYPASQLSPDSMFEYATMLSLSEKVDEAVRQYREVFTVYPQSPLAEDGMLKRGDVLYAQGRYKEARDAYYEHRLHFPSGKLMDSSLFWGGMASLKAGEPFGAVLLWEKLIRDFPASSFRSDSIQKSAIVYADRGDYRKALALYTELLASYPEDAAAVKADREAEKLSFILLGQGEREAELQVIITRERRAETPAGREAMIELGRLYIYSDDATKQEIAFSLLSDVVARLQSDPGTAARGQYYVGEFFFKRGDMKRASAEFVKAATMNPQDKDLMAMSMYRAAESLALSGSRAEAERMVERLSASFPSSQWAIEGKKLLEGAK
jgi:TolA-binding protein